MRTAAGRTGVRRRPPPFVTMAPVSRNDGPLTVPMIPSAQPAGTRDVTALVRRIHRDRLSGVLEVELAEGRRRLHFVDGELHLPSDHPLASALEPHLGGLPGRSSRRRDGAGRRGGPEVRALMTRIAFLIAGWAQEGEARFHPRMAARDERLVGPLPTVLLLMEWAAAGDEGTLLERVGGEGAEVVAESSRAPFASQAAHLLDPQAAVLLARLGRATTVGDLLRQSAAGRARVLADLARLVAAGLVHSLETGEEAAVGELSTGVVPQPVAPDVVHRYADRIGRDLESRPMVLDADSHRSRLADLLTRSGGLTAYELLGISGSARDQEIHEAYQRLARLTHPSHSDRLQLAGGERPLWLLFEQATAAYLTLSQPDRRRRYDQRLASLTATAAPAPRGDEERSLARSYYERAEALVEAEDFHFAVELLKQAIHTHPRPEYYVLLGRVQAKNPNWLRHAMDSYRKAMELGAEDGRISLALGRLCEEMENFEEARRHYQAALAANPAETDARAGLARLLGREETEGEDRGSPARWSLSNLLGRRR